ncbi:MAG: flagellar basal-body rod protein FlgF [Thermodesulfobacteriota bacterium]
MRQSQIFATLGTLRQEHRISHQIANNLSNVQTPGFKRDVPIFSTLLSQAMDSDQRLFLDQTQTSFRQGNIQRTGNPLDLAIEGEGFFKVLTPEGVRYTRAGNFSLNKDMVLTNAEGFPVVGRRDEIILSGGTISVDKDGTIRVNGEEREKVTLVSFQDLDLLKKEGHTLFGLKIPQEEIVVQNSQIHQGALEDSNVNPIEEMVNLIDALRAFESCVKIVQCQDEMDSKAVNDLGKV